MIAHDVGLYLDMFAELGNWIREVSSPVKVTSSVQIGRRVSTGRRENKGQYWIHVSCGWYLPLKRCVGSWMYSWALLDSWRFFDELKTTNCFEKVNAFKGYRNISVLKMINRFDYSCIIPYIYLQNSNDLNFHYLTCKYKSFLVAEWNRAKLKMKIIFLTLFSYSVETLVLVNNEPLIQWVQRHFRSMQWLVLFWNDVKFERFP